MIQGVKFACRITAMQALVEDKVLEADHPVPCLVRADDVEPGEVSLAENVVSFAMHPADQVVAFTKLVQAGYPARGPDMPKPRVPPTVGSYFDFMCPARHSVSQFTSLAPRRGPS